MTAHQGTKQLHKDMDGVEELACRVLSCLSKAFQEELKLLHFNCMDEEWEVTQVHMHVKANMRVHPLYSL